jgi:hypothetical protein
MMDSLKKQMQDNLINLFKVIKQMPDSQEKQAFLKDLQLIKDQGHDIKTMQRLLSKYTALTSKKA